MREEYCLFCLPSAGSNASMYFQWRYYAPEWLHVVPVEYPGHGTRVTEALLADAHSLVQDIVKFILHYPREDKKIILFGHSLGAALVWRVQALLQNILSVDDLALLVLSGRAETSYIKDKLKGKYLLSDDKFLTFIKGYAGIPNEILENQDALDFFLPILKNDLKINDDLLDNQEQKTSVPLLAISGYQDIYVSESSLNHWAIHSEKWLGSKFYEGGHFFLNQTENAKNIISLIEKTLCSFHDAE